MDFNKRCISKEEFKKHEDSDVAYALYVRNNLKPNDYFRTFDGQIFKSMNVSPIKGNKIYYLNGDYTWVDVSAVANFSDNIIDLIEVGDYVNGDKVTEEMIKMRDEQGVFGLPDKHRVFIDEIKVKNIVTKEQFNSVKYEVE